MHVIKTPLKNTTPPQYKHTTFTLHLHNPRNHFKTYMPTTTQQPKQPTNKLPCNPKTTTTKAQFDVTLRDRISDNTPTFHLYKIQIYKYKTPNHNMMTPPKQQP